MNDIISWLLLIIGGVFIIGPGWSSDSSAFSYLIIGCVLLVISFVIGSNKKKGD